MEGLPVNYCDRRGRHRCTEDPSEHPVINNNGGHTSSLLSVVATAAAVTRTPGTTRRLRPWYTYRSLIGPLLRECNAESETNVTCESDDVRPYALTRRAEDSEDRIFDLSTHDGETVNMVDDGPRWAFPLPSEW